MSPEIVVVCGVAGSGKTSVGQKMAELLAWDFKDGDDVHPQANREKMAKGIPLTDEDRLPWLDAIARCGEGNSRIVFACSALKGVYRQLLRERMHCRFVLLDVSRPLLEERLCSRKGHFMPATLLDSQLATLERPDTEPDVLVIPILNHSQTVDQISQRAKTLLKL